MARRFSLAFGPRSTASPAVTAEPLESIRRRARDPRTRTDRPTRADAGDLRPATGAQIDAAETSLDFALPAFLRLVYTEIGNGGFGPGCGLIGVAGGATDEHGNSIVDLYDHYSASNPEDAAWRWPGQLVPICHWGGGVYSCADGALPGAPLVHLDLTEYEPGCDLGQLLSPQPSSLERWLLAWAAGDDLWQEMFRLDV